MTKSSIPPKPPKLPKPEEQIRPDALIRTIKNEKPTAQEKLKDIPVTPENYRRFKGEKSRRAGLPRGIWWGVAGLAAAFVIGSFISFYVVKMQVKQTVTQQAQTLAAGVADLQNFDTPGATQEFSSLVANNGTPSFESVLGFFGSMFTGGRNAVAAFGDLAQQLAALSSEASSLEGSVASGTNLVPQLTAVRDTLAAINTDSDQLSGVLTSVGGSSTTAGLLVGGSYLPLKARVAGAESFLNALIPWLASSTPHHVLVLFENPSEMRPGGGFLGSYADVTVASGSIAGITVHDIADIDSSFTGKIVPPQPLQLEVNSFRPADGNWFFDFPTSASETLQLFAEASSTKYDGVIAISPQVVSDLLSITGPVTVTSTTMKPTTFDANDVVVQIQNIVQQGQASQSTYPKSVLGNLSQAIFSQLAASSTDAQKEQLLSAALAWVTNRDVMAYFQDPDFENFIASYGGAGDVYQLPQNFNGDYLAVADADINSDKSELYVAQNLSFDAQIGTDGTIDDTLKITRTHNGNKSPYWWYQTTNQDYVQVFVPDGASLVDETGGVVKRITPPLNYASPRNGYSTDPTIAAIASTTQSFLLYPAVTAHQEDGKEVFATWAVTPKGKTTSLEFDYTHRAFVPPAAGVQYQFVFEKQSGSARSYNLEIDAPLGYVFAETGLATYEYQSSDPPGRLVIDLTLEKL